MIGPFTRICTCDNWFKNLGGVVVRRTVKNIQ